MGIKKWINFTTKSWKTSWEVHEVSFRPPNGFPGVRSSWVSHAHTSTTESQKMKKPFNRKIALDILKMDRHPIVFGWKGGFFWCIVVLQFMSRLGKLGIISTSLSVRKLFWHFEDQKPHPCQKKGSKKNPSSCCRAPNRPGGIEVVDDEIHDDSAIYCKWGDGKTSPMARNPSGRLLVYENRINNMVDLFLYMGCYGMVGLFFLVVCIFTLYTCTKLINEGICNVEVDFTCGWRPGLSLELDFEMDLACWDG